MPISVLHDDKALRVVSDGHALVPTWFDTPQPEQMRALVRVAEAHFHRLHNQKHVVLNIVVDGSPNYSDEMRRLTAETARRVAPWRVATAHVILVGGLRGVVARSIMSTVLLLSRSKVPTKAFDSVDAAAPWALPYLRQTDAWDEERIRKVCDAARKPRAVPGHIA